MSQRLQLAARRWRVAIQTRVEVCVCKHRLRRFRRTLSCWYARKYRGDNFLWDFVIPLKEYSELEIKALCDYMMLPIMLSSPMRVRRTLRQSTNGCVGWLEFRHKGKLVCRKELHLEITYVPSTSIVFRQCHSSYLIIAYHEQGCIRES